MNRPLALCLAVAMGALSLGAGILFAERGQPLDLQCHGSSAQLLPNSEQRQWLLHRYDLDLRSDGQGDYKARLRLLDSGSGQNLGYLHRSASFAQQRQGQRLLLQVFHSGSGDTGNLEARELAGLGLFVFNEGMRLSYRLRQLAPGSLLIGNGQGGVLLCVQNR